MSHDNDMIRSEGRTVDEAISEALLHLGARKEEVEITVIEEGKSGLFGVLGRKAACVEVRRKPRKRSRRRGGRGRRRGGGEGDGGSDQQNNAAARNDNRQGGERDEGESRGRGRGRGGRGRGGEGRDDQGRGRRDGEQQGRGRQDRDRQDRQEEPRREPRRRDERPAARQDGEARSTQEQREPRQRRERPRRDDRSRDQRPRDERPRDERPRDERPADEVAAVPRQEREGGERPHRERRERRPRGRDRDREESGNRNETREETRPMQDNQPNEAPRTEERPAATVISGDPLAAMEMAKVLPAIEAGDIDATIAQTAEDLLRRCGIFSRAMISEGDDGYRNVRIVTDANSADVMAGRRNSMISAVQHLCDRIASRASGDHVKVDVDINNYRQRRDGGLAQMAEGAMNRVKESGEPQHLDPMNARERRIVHMEVAEVEGVDTTTVGEGPDRHVVIIPEGFDMSAAPEEQSGE